MVAGQLGASRFVLNRFYDKVSPAKDIEYFFSHFFILGDKEFQVYGPGVNRKIYTDNNFVEAPYIGYNYDLKWIDILERKSNVAKEMLMMGFSDEKLEIYRLTKIQPNITCSFDEDVDIWVKSFGTCP